MFDNVYKDEIEWQGEKLSLETGRIARQADAAVFVKYGETTVIATVVTKKKGNSEYDFLPLTVNYSEKAYAAGKIPGGYFKREGRPSERETYISRLIDRPIRPLFHKDFAKEIQVIVTVLSHDGKNDPDIISIIAVSAALSISGAPFNGPIAAARVAVVDEKIVVNPDAGEIKQKELDLVVAATKDAVIMVESEASQISQSKILEAIDTGYKQMQPVIEMIERMQKERSKPQIEFEKIDCQEVLSEIEEKISEKIKLAYQNPDKNCRKDIIFDLQQEIIKEYTEKYTEDLNIAKKAGRAFKQIERNIVRNDIIKNQKRIDGRKSSEIREIVPQAGVLPRVHGSALFTRGETQALVVVTLGSAEDEQYVDALEGTFKRRFMLHYNFPPFCVGEVGRAGFTSRREIGHGRLAWKAINSLLLDSTQFPYTLRIVSDITESNGSSSMATVCGASLALMDAGVKFNGPVAGIAMGLIKQGDEFVVLSDILGDEDHLGDMDFKVTATKKGITALQMDIKIDGINQNIMKQALEQAVKGIDFIIENMDKEISKPRENLNQYVPKIETIKIPVEKIRDVIGAGGKTIRQITEETDTKIDIVDDGTIKVVGSDLDSIKKALHKIKMLTTDPTEGEIYQGTVVKIMEFGAFVNFYGAKDGLVHVSQISTRRIDKVEDVLTKGDKVKVKFLGLDNRGKIRLTMKNIEQS